MIYKGMSGWKALGFKSYNEYLLSDFWKEKRENILDVFGRKCQKCGAIKSLVVHHLSYLNIGNEKAKDVQVLCWNCHDKEYKK